MVGDYLWDFSNIEPPGAPGGFHIVGFSLAINEFVNGSNTGLLNPTNQNKTLQARTITFPGSGNSVLVARFRARFDRRCHP